MTLALLTFSGEAFANTLVIGAMASFSVCCKSPIGSGLIAVARFTFVVRMDSPLLNVIAWLVNAKNSFGRIQLLSLMRIDICWSLTLMLLVMHLRPPVRLGYPKWRRRGVPHVCMRLSEKISGLMRSLFQLILKGVYVSAADAGAPLVH
jgi:hypothetical protein